MMKIISMDLRCTGVVAYYVLVAARNRLFLPTASEANHGAYADPVLQFFVTAIFIGFSIQALMLIGVMKLSRNTPILESSAIDY